VDVPLVAIDAPPSAIGGLVRTHWDAGEAVLPLPWSGARTVAERRTVQQVLDRLAPRTIVRVAAAGAPPTQERHSTDEPARLPAGTALVVTTSGSTGESKAVVLSHDALRASTAASLERLGATHGDRFALALPTHHIAGLQVLLRAWSCRTEPLVLAAGDTVLPAGGGVVSLVPTQLHRMVASRPATLHDWTVLVGGGPVDPGSVDRARAAGATVVISYGMSETCGGCVYDGVPLDGVGVDVRSA
jgi:o-succinylbenzoate---CoA ligase